MEVIYKLADIGSAAKRILNEKGGSSVIAFKGEMGAGKTTFIHAICEALQIEDTVTSPTFSIINQYKTKSGDTVYHMDLYRIKDENEAIEAGVEDCLFSGALCLVEWPEKAPGIFPDNSLWLNIIRIHDDTRKINT